MASEALAEKIASLQSQDVLVRLAGHIAACAVK
jgi:hypothetical protein